VHRHRSSQHHGLGLPRGRALRSAVRLHGCRSGCQGHSRHLAPLKMTDHAFWGAASTRSKRSTQGPFGPRPQARSSRGVSHVHAAPVAHHGIQSPAAPAVYGVGCPDPHIPHRTRQTRSHRLSASGPPSLVAQAIAVNRMLPMARLSGGQRLRTGPPRHRAISS